MLQRDNPRTIGGGASIGWQAGFPGRCFKTAGPTHEQRLGRDDRGWQLGVGLRVGGRLGPERPGGGKKFYVVSTMPGDFVLAYARTRFDAPHPVGDWKFSAAAIDDIIN